MISSGEPSDPVNTTESVHVCDNLNHTNNKNVQRGENIEVLICNCALSMQDCFSCCWNLPKMERT